MIKFLSLPFFLYSEVTEGALQVWRALPERIRQDPSLASFRMEHERLHGGEYIKGGKNSDKRKTNMIS